MLEQKVKDAMADIQDELNLLVPYMGFNPSEEYEMPTMFVREANHNRSQATCQCCLNDFGVDVKEYYSEICLEEEMKACHICGIGFHFAYGYMSLWIDNIQWGWTYLTPDKEMNILHMEIQIVTDIYKRIAQDEKPTEDELHFLSLLKDRSILEYKLEEGGYYA
jgi:hypothetical protein